MSKRHLRGAQNHPVIKLVLLGSQGVGKSALMVRFLTRRFIGEYDPYLESTHRRHIGIGNSTLVIDMKDTAGENGTQRREKDFVWGDAFILVYSVTQEKSFEEIQRIHKLIEMTRTNNAMFIVIGNKKDLHHLREVSKDDGKKLSEKYSCPFYEISVSEGYNETNKTFNDIIRYILRTKASEEGANLKKRGTSFTSLLKGLEKQYKIARENKERKHEKILDIREVVCV
ncbi:ras-related and estrogen-regulated growth inhibitor-like [Hydractinia symbiolongicarpus]|uniref:ras-related and estrogen-regulated growth inhibitor-like n=1 Tax=Hydractinia symbiolongicarpus TaxID=13093 RepID=UPI00254C6F04|nr:ras-related and estrogen-regulated growth inhibitor-like [Hydractinia symbiolongicarpus]